MPYKNKLLAVVLFSLVFVFPARVSAATRYVSTTGSDTNTGLSLSSAYQTLAKGVSVLAPGDTLLIAGGTYTNGLDINKSGIAGSPIKIKPLDVNPVIVNVGTSLNYAIRITGNYVEISDIRTVGSGWAGLDLRGSNLVVDGIDQSRSKSHGIIVFGTNVVVKNSKIYDSVLENVNKNAGNWGSGLKVERGAVNVTFDNNQVYHNMGEGIAVTMGKNVNVVHNTSYDNFSVNLYIDNSSDVLVDSNYIYCTPNTTYYRGTNPANSIAMGEEKGSPWYDGWGAQLMNITITNNIMSGCNYFTYFGSMWTDTTSYGLKNALIANNTILDIFNKTSAFYIAGDTYNSNIRIVNNIASGYISTGGAITTSNNLASTTYTVTPNIADPTTFTPAAGSTAVNKGASVGVNTDFFGRTRPVGSAVDIGAIEYGATSPATSPSPSTSPSPTPLLGDANSSNSVDIIDYTIWLNSYLTKPVSTGSIYGDFDNNSIVDGIDYMIWVNNYKI